MSGTPVNIPVMTIEDANKLIESGQNIIECLPTGQKRFITCVDGFEGAVDAVRKGQPVKGLEFFNPTDGSIQVLRQNGGVLVCYDSPGLEAKVIDYLAKNKDALKSAEGIKNFVKFLGENAGINPATGLADVWDSDIKWASKLTGAPEQIGNGTVFSGAKAQEAVQAIPVKVGTRFTGPTGTPQIAGTEGAYILRDSSGNMHMIQARQFSEAYSPVKAMTNVGKTAEARIPFSLNMSVSDATHLAGQKVGDAFRVVKGSKAGQAVGNAVGKVVSNPAIRKAGQILGRAAKGLGPIGTLLLLTDGKLVTKFSKGRVVEAATDVVKSIKDIKLTDFKELWNVVKEHPKELWKTFCDGYKMSMESLGIDLMPERFADVKTRQGYVKKTLEDEYGRPIIKNGEVQTEDTFYIATQSKSNPNQISFLQRMETEKIPVGIFDLDKGRVVAEYNEYSDENIRVRMRTEYDSTNVTTLEKRYGIGLSDFNRMSGLNFFPQTPIGKPTKITTETNFDGNNPNRDFGFNEEYTNIWCEKEIRNVKTEYPVYFKDGTKMASDIVVKSTVQRKTYPITEQEREHLFEIYNRDPGTLEPVKKAMLELIAKKDKEMQEHPDVGLCQEDISENTTYGREHYKENPDLKNIKTPDDPEFINQYDRAWVKVESYNDKKVGLGKEVAVPLDSSSISIGYKEQMARDNNGRVISGKLNYQNHQVSGERATPDSAYDYMGEKAVFVHRKNANGQTEVAKMIRVNPNTGVIKEFDSDGKFVDVHIPQSEKYDELALTIQSAVKVPGFNEKKAQERLAARKQEENSPTELYTEGIPSESKEVPNSTAANSENKEDKTNLTVAKGNVSPESKEVPSLTAVNSKNNLLTALKGCATEYREEISSPDLANGRNDLTMA